MSPAVSFAPVLKSIDVDAPPPRAFEVFTAFRWWPKSHSILASKSPQAAVTVEPHVGGRWYERGDDGSTCQWGSVLSWEPTTRLVLSWDITANWQYDPELKTEIEVKFIADGKNGTRVELEHRRLDRYGERRDEMRAIFETQGDWGKLLQRFAQAAAA